MLNFDVASTTKICNLALDEYVKTSEIFYNPSALYGPAYQSKQIIEQARAYILKSLKATNKSTLIFTSCATESNNAVLINNITRKDKRYLIGGGEHSSIYETAKHLISLGYNIEFIPLSKNGGIDLKKFNEMLDNKVDFVSVMHVSNETGAINDIKQIVQLTKQLNPNAKVHSDGVQAIGKIDVNLTDLGVDYYTISAHKINGPKGIGALYIAKPNQFKAFIHGGEQEMGLKAGTENVPAIASFKVAFENLHKYDYSLHKAELINNLSGDYLLVSDNQCVDNIISVCFNGVRGETLVHMLESNDILIGTGSSCNSKAKFNRVLANIVPKDYLGGAVRFSFDNSVTIDDCKYVAQLISQYAKQYYERIKR